MQLTEILNAFFLWNFEVFLLFKSIYFFWQYFFIHQGLYYATSHSISLLSSTSFFDSSFFSRKF